MGQFPGVVIDVGGVGNYMSKVDTKIYCIKEMYCSMKARLPWILPKALVKDSVQW